MAVSSLRGNWLAVGLVAAVAGAGFGLSNWQGRVHGADSVSAKTPQDHEAIGAANALSHAFRHAAEVADPSVVKIHSHTVAKKVKGTARGRNPLEGLEDMLPGDSDMFKHFDFKQFDNGAVPERDGVGSGVIIDKSGIVLTNNHVVQGSDELIVTLSDGREFKATDVKTDPQTDLAVIRIKAKDDLPAAKLGNSDDLAVGDWVIAIGCPFELDHTVSAGIISSKSRELSDLNRSRFLQTDAAINPGNSGGPLVNIDGEVVGINTAIASSSGGNQGIGFSIPINSAKWITSQLIDKGKVSRGYLGIQLEEINADLAGKLGVRKGDGVLVADVMPNTPAAAAGVKEGDIVTGFSGTAVHNPRELRDLVEKTPVGSKHSLTVNRDGKSMSMDINIKALPDSLADSGARMSRRHGDDRSPTTFSANDLGMEVTEFAGGEAKTFEGFSGVLIRNIEEGSVAAKAGLQPGMLIRKVGKSDVKSVEDFANALKHESLKDGVMLLIRSTGGNRYIVLRQS